MNLDQIDIEDSDDSLKVISLATAMVAMGLKDALHEEPDNPVLIPLARELISSYMLKTFGVSDSIANRMADSLMKTILKELDL